VPYQAAVPRYVRLDLALLSDQVQAANRQVDIDDHGMTFAGCFVDIVADRPCADWGNV